MHLTPYRRVLSLPGVRALMLVALVARVPVVASGITMTLHVVLDLDGSYAAAGLVGAMFTVSSAVGAPLLGRLVDRTSLRTALVICVASDALFWAVAPLLPYAALVVAAGVVGLLTLPVFSIVRQSIAALVPEAQRRQAYALDSMALEVSFMAGPTLAVLLVTRVSAMFAMYAVGTAIVLAGLAMYVLNPPMRSAHEATTGSGRVPRRAWLRPRFLALLAASAATTMVLAGTDLSLVATLRAGGEVAWVGAVLAAWGVYSLAGGFVHGAVRRGLPTVVLLGLLSLFTVPVGVADSAGWLVLVLIPCGALCAPTLASAADGVSRLVPAAARGEAMGLHNSALTLGLAAGAPLAGAVIDAYGPAWGFALVGGLGLVVTVALLPILARHTPTPPEQTGPVGAAGPAVGAAGPAVGAAGPAVGAAGPAVGAAGPAVGAAGPAIGDGGPSGPAGPAVGDGGPSGPAGPAVGDGGPSGPAGPAVGDGGPSGPAGPAVGDGGPSGPAVGDGGPVGGAEGVGEAEADAAVAATTR